MYGYPSPIAFLKLFSIMNRRLRRAQPTTERTWPVHPTPECLEQD